MNNELINKVIQELREVGGPGSGSWDGPDQPRFAKGEGEAGQVASQSTYKGGWDKMTKEEFADTFTGNISSIKINDEPITIFGRYQKGRGIKSAKYTSNFGQFNKQYKTYDEAVEGIYNDLKRVKTAPAIPVAKPTEIPKS